MKLLCKLTKPWRIIILIVGALVISDLLIITHQPRSRISSENVSVRNDIRSKLKISDNEEELKKFLVKKGWESSYDPILGGYDYELKVGSQLFEEHLLLIRFLVTDHRVVDIKVEDFHRTL